MSPKMLRGWMLVLERPAVQVILLGILVLYPILDSLAEKADGSVVHTGRTRDGRVASDRCVDPTGPAPGTVPDEQLKFLPREVSLEEEIAIRDALAFRSAREFWFPRPLLSYIFTVLAFVNEVVYSVVLERFVCREVFKSVGGTQVVVDETESSATGTGSGTGSRFTTVREYPNFRRYFTPVTGAAGTGSSGLQDLLANYSPVLLSLVSSLWVPWALFMTSQSFVALGMWFK